MNGRSEREQSSRENSTSSQSERAYFTHSIAVSTTASGVMRSLHSMWSGEVAMKTWMRGCFASFTASHARSMSALRQRASDATTVFFAARASACTASKSPGDDAAKPASTMSTPSASRCSRTSSLSARFIEQPGDCSPSRSVESKILIRRVSEFIFG